MMFAPWIPLAFLVHIAGAERDEVLMLQTQFAGAERMDHDSNGTNSKAVVFYNLFAKEQGWATILEHLVPNSPSEGKLIFQTCSELAYILSLVYSLIVSFLAPLESLAPSTSLDTFRSGW